MIRRTLGSVLPFLLTAGLAAPHALAGEDAGSAAVRARIAAALAEPETPEPFDQPDLAERFFTEQRIAPGTAPDVAALYLRAREHVRSMPRYSLRLGRLLASPRSAGGARARAELATWEELGPGNIGGRTRALVIDPTSPRTMYAAGVSGGIWKSTNGGRRWRPLDDLLPNIAVSALAMDPADPAILYAGTGEGYFREVVRGTDLPLRGAGILKTTDGGTTWEQLESTQGADFQWVNDVVVSANDSRRVYAATRTGVWRSKDAGGRWTRILDARDVLGGCFDLALRSDQPRDVLFAACGTFEQATVWRNRRAEKGRRFKPVLSEPGMGRTSLALAPSNQDVVYALSASTVGGPGGNFDGGLHAVFRSDDGGTPGSWRATVRNDDPVKLNTLILTNPLIATQVACGAGSQDAYSTLGWYTNTIAVDPVDPEIVWAGGVDLFRSDDGGEQWGLATYWWDSPPSAHADQHAIVFDPRYDGVRNRRMFLGNDGGVWRTTNARAEVATGDLAACDSANTGLRWRALDKFYGVTQFYDGTPFPDGRTVFGGTQDNGTLIASEEDGRNGWRRIWGGDGGYVAVDPTNPDVLYAESQFLGFVKSVDGGASFTDAIAGIGEARGNFLFVTPFTMDPSDPQRLWVGGRQLWRTDDGAGSWQAASSVLSTSAKVSALAVAPSDSDRVIVGLSDGRIFRNSQATSATGTTVWSESRPREGGWVAWLAFDPHDADVVYATYTTFGGLHVFKSVDGGANWNSLDGQGPNALPDLPVHSILVDPNDSNRLVIGTDLGVFVSTEGGNSWAEENTGFAHAVTESLSVLEHDGTASVYAFTHGRGAWRVDLR